MPALKLVAMALREGELKYDRYNYRLGLEWTRYAGGALRHIGEWLEGEDWVKDSQHVEVHTLAAAAANCLMALQNALDGVGIDDRYKSASITQSRTINQAHPTTKSPTTKSSSEESVRDILGHQEPIARANMQITVDTVEESLRKAEAQLPWRPMPREYFIENEDESNT